MEGCTTIRDTLRTYVVLEKGYNPQLQKTLKRKNSETIGKILNERFKIFFLFIYTIW